MAGKLRPSILLSFLAFFTSTVVNSVVIEVSTVRDSVSLMLALATCLEVSRRITRIFSRRRSKITIESLIE